MKKTQTINILYVIDSLKLGGKEKQLMELAKSLSKIYKITILTFDFNIEYSEIYALPIKLIINNLNRKSIKFQFFLRNLLKKEKINIVHTWDLISSLAVGIQLKFFKIKHINGCLRGSARLKKISKASFLYKLSFFFSDIVISNSKAGLLAKKVMNNKKFTYIYNGIDLSNIIVNETVIINKKKEMAINTKYVIGMVATFREGKDYFSLIEAGEKLCKKRNDITIIGVGNGLEHFLINNNAVKCNRIKLFGKRQDIYEIISFFDIGILLSVETELHGEGISNSIMEYMALGKPVITTKSGGNCEIVYNNKNGFVIEEKNVDELVNKIEFLLDNNYFRKKFGEKGRNIIETKFSLKTMVDNYNNIYLNIF